MSLPRVRVVDIHHNNEIVDLDELTQTGLGLLIHECELLLEELKDAEANKND